MDDFIGFGIIVVVIISIVAVGVCIKKRCAAGAKGRGNRRSNNGNDPEVGGDVEIADVGT